MTVTSSANRKIYQANRQSPIFEELHGLIAKTVGLVEPLRHALKPFAKEIDLAFVYGSVAKGKDTAKSDIDLMIIGTSSPTARSMRPCKRPRRFCFDRSIRI